MANEAGTYKLLGSKNPGERVDRVILEGDSNDPERYVDLNGEAELSAEEVENLRGRGYEIRKVTEAASDEDRVRQAEQEEREAEARKEAEEAGEAPVQEAVSGSEGGEVGTAPVADRPSKKSTK